MLSTHRHQDRAEENLRQLVLTRVILVNDVNVDTRVCTTSAFIGYPAYATTELGLSLLGIDQVSVENPEDGRAVVANARCCVGALSVETFHKLDGP